MALFPSSNLKIAQIANALYGAVVGTTTNNAVLADIASVGYDTTVNGYYTYTFGATPKATVAANMAANMGITTASVGAANVTVATNYIVGQLNANPGKEGVAMTNVLGMWSGMTSDPVFGAVATAWNATIANAQAYTASGSTADVSIAGAAAGMTYLLTTGIQNILGTAGADTFNAYIQDNANTLQSGDVIDGGAGVDTLYADIGNSQSFAITAQTSNIENISIRAQSNDSEWASNNTNNQDGVNIDAQRMTGVSKWESSNSRADVIIEDVRINSNVSTIAFVESDPGNVDLAVYFNQKNLVNTTSSASSLNINVMDTGAAATPATAATPLLNNPYDTFKFYANGALVTLALPAAAAADTYALLLTAFQAAIAANPTTAGVVTATLGANFTVTDPISNTAVTGQTITLAASGNFEITTPTGSGWFNTTGASVPATSNMYTTYASGGAATAALVSTKIILDDVGMGSTGGDLLVGGMSTGDTSTSKGVERFEIEVRDNSKLQTINSTDNTLREVVIVNGVTTSSSSAYVTTTANAGNLTVNGTNFGTNTEILAVDAALAGAETGSAVGNHSSNGAAGFTDVRLIDGSAMTGKFAFTAAITSDSIAKYINLVDTAASPTADVATANTVGLGANFIYTGGANADTMVVTMDTAAVSSRSTVVSGQSDFTFNISGGAGNDAITTTVMGSSLAGGAQAWYNNQKLNANIAINGGDGNDTIRTPGAGDVIINADAGDDVVYTDNTGVLATANATGSASAAALAYSNAAAAELAAGLAASVASNTTGFVTVAGTTTGAAVTTAAAATALNTLNLVTPDGTHAAVVAAGGAIPVHSVVIAAIDAATAAGGLTFAQNIALQAAYGNWTTAGSVTPAATMIAQTITGAVATADGTVITAAQYDAGNALLDTYIAAAKAAAATATSNDAIVAGSAAYNATLLAPVAGELLNATQQAVVVATQAVNGVFDPVAAVAGLTYAPVVTNGVNEINTFTPAPLAAAGTTIINGLTLTAGGAGATAAAVELALETATTSATVTVTGAYTAAWTVSAGAAGTVVYTSTATGNPANLVDTGTSALAPVVTAATAETVAVTIAGVGAAGETVTFDGVTHAVGGLTAVQVATLIDNQATDTNWTDVAAGAVLNLTSVTLGNVTDLAAGNFVTGNTVAAAGTQTTVNNLAALNSALATGATDAAVVTALQAAIANGSISVVQGGTLFTAATSSGVNAINATDLAAIAMILTPLQTAAANANTAAQATLTAALAADVTAVNTAAAFAAADPVAAGLEAVAEDSVGSAEAAAAVVTATAAATAAQTVLTPLTTQSSNLAALKSAIAVGTTDLAVVTATTNAVANGAINAAAKVAIDAAAGAAVPAVAGVVVAAEKTAVDLLITALQLTNETAVASQTKVVADLQAIVTATTTAATIATAAAASGANSLTITAPKAVYVFDTTNQMASYNRLTADDRNLADLKSDNNDSYNFFNSTVKVSYKGIDASVVVAGTGYKTSDLEINQAIKKAINTDAVLSKLLVATDGPANSLVVTSLIDGTHTTVNLAVTVTLPTTVGVDVAAAAAAYGLPVGTTEAALLASMATAKATFDTNGDYVTQFAESGAAGGNTLLVGGNSLSSSDNTITGGTGNDVIVLGTTVGTDAMTSSNEKVIYNAAAFGNDTVVYFTASGLGIDTLDFTALKGSGAVAFGSLSLDKSIVVAAETLANDSATEIAALFTDSATAINHVYIAYNANNIASVYTVADAAGTAAGNVTATLVGTIDLADTGWSTLTAANFA